MECRKSALSLLHAAHSSNKAQRAAEQIVNRIYPGADLSATFAAEIARYNDIWDWIQARINTANYTGIHVGDYIPFTAGGNSIKAEIAGIDTYYNYSNIPVGHHIDFISRDCWPDAHVWNKVNYNNGIVDSPNPWLCSDIYAWLNSLAMNVPNATTADPATIAVDYTSAGVYDKLPTALKAVITPKHVNLPIRFTEGGLLNADNGWSWEDIGKLWLPSEVEVYGCEHWGSHNGYSGAAYVQYPLFGQCMMKRMKSAGEGGSSTDWWTASLVGDSSTRCARVGSNGRASDATATTGGICTPLCFRIGSKV